ncbi:MAG: CapA family protein [Nitrososphaerales archaeon]
MIGKNRAILIVVAAATVFALLAEIFLLPVQQYRLNDDASELTRSRESISMVAVGDSIAYNIPSEDLAGLSDIIGKPDIFIFNLEGALLESVNDVMKCEKLPHQSLLTASSSSAKYLKLASTTIANMANNHVLDCRSEGIERTKNILASNDILSVGAGQNLDEACKPLFVKVNNWKIAFVSYNFVTLDKISAGTDKGGAASLEGCKHDYSKIRSEGVDLIIASIHYGIWSADVDKDQIQLENKLFGSGVDIVIGHSPHIPQAIMSKDGKLAFFSLGNFIFRPDYKMPALAYTSIVPKIEIYRDKIEVTIYPDRIGDDGIPYLDKVSSTQGNGEIITRIAKVSKALNTDIDLRDNLGYLSVQRGR